MPAQPAADVYRFPPADLMNLGVYYYPEAWPSWAWLGPRRSRRG